MAHTELKGVIFDLDGVITGTARVHSMAWKSMFDGYLQLRADRDGESFSEFTDEDYLLYVDGKPRMQGVKSFLESRGIDLPFGDHSDEPDKETVCGLGNRKNADFQEVLKREGPDVYQTSVDLIRRLKELGIRVGVASSSRNCKLILELADLEDLFETRVDGDVSLELGLKGKPNPDIFTTAAANVGLLPGQCVVVEDAISGVQAGRAGNFGLTLGVAREMDGETLLAEGADMVVTDLGEIDVEDLLWWFDEGIEADGWTFGYMGYDPEQEKLRETMTAVGNGYMGVRGAGEFEDAGEHHYPGTYLAGVFNKIPTPLHGRDIYNNDFVNCPNWLKVEFKVGKGAYQPLMDMDILSYVHMLSMFDAVMERMLTVRDQLGRVFQVRTRRLASMADPHTAALAVEVTPVNWSGPLTFRSSIDGGVINDGVPRYRALNQQHLEFVDAGKAATGMFLHARTTASKYDIVMAARHRMTEDGKKIEAEREIGVEGNVVFEELTVDAYEGSQYTLEKLLNVHTSLDQPKKPKTAAVAKLGRAKSFHQVYTSHAKTWARLWERADVVVGGDRLVQQTARLHAYHLLCTASPHNKNLDAGMPARGLNGEAYRGHIFWDELYIMPFFDLKFPEISKALLDYRYTRLDGARQYARENGYDGAMYPWQTADGGGEETQEVHYNPKSDSWGPDLSRRQRHVSIAVFYNVWRYVHCSNDHKFLLSHGAELMVSIARFWGSIAEKDEATGRYHIEGVMGPDEFHEADPESHEPGLKDNAYTNIMVAWLMGKVLKMLEGLSPAKKKALKEKIGLKDAEPVKWAEMAENLNVIVEDGIIEQFEGYFGLKDLDWEAYREKYGDIHRMDRILKAEGDTPDHYKVAKQADTLMTFYVLAPEVVTSILAGLGIDVGDAATFLKKNYDYYEGRTSHGSTLSKVVHAVISSHFGDDATAWQWFSEALVSDIHDTQGGTTPEGIHTGVMAGTLDIMTRYFAGIDTTGEILRVNPHLPVHWTSLELGALFKGTWFWFVFEPGKVVVTAEDTTPNAPKDAVHLRVGGKSVELVPGRPKTVTLA